MTNHDVSHKQRLKAMLASLRATVGKHTLANANAFKNQPSKDIQHFS